MHQVAAAWRLAAFSVAMMSPAMGASVVEALPITESTTHKRAGAGQAALDVAGIASMDHFRSPFNTVIFLWVGPFNTVNGIGWDVVLQTVAPGSLLSEMGMIITNSAMHPVPNFGFRPAGLNNMPGGPTQFIRNLFKLSDLGLPNVQALADGLIRLEFADTPDNLSGQADGLWVSGTVLFQTLNPIPNPVAPGTMPLFAALGIVAARRMRRG